MTKTYEINYNWREEDSAEFQAKIEQMTKEGLPIFNLRNLRWYEIQNLLKQEGHTLEDLLGYKASTSRELKRAKKGKHPFNWLEARRYRSKHKKNLDYFTNDELYKKVARDNKEIDTYKRPLIASELESAANHALPRSDYKGIIVYHKDSFGKSIKRGGGSFGHYTLYNLKESENPVAVIEIKRPEE